MPRQPFSDFLDLDQPSFSPRGGRGGGNRGRGSGRGGFQTNSNSNSPSTSTATPDGGRGRGRGRGGSSGFRGRGGASLRADYRAVPPIDYSRINKENYKTMTGFTPSPHDQSTSTPHRTPRTPRQPYPTHTNTPPVLSGSTTPKGNDNKEVLGWSGSPSSTYNTPTKQQQRGKPSGVGFPALGSLRGRGSGHLTGLSREFSPSPSNSNSNSKSYPGSYTPGNGAGRGGRGGTARKFVDMGAPVFVKAGTLFQDEAHQPDMPVESVEPALEQPAEPRVIASKPVRAESELRDMDRVESLVRQPSLAPIVDSSSEAEVEVEDEQVRVPAPVSEHGLEGSGSTVAGSEVSEKEEEELRESLERVTIQPEVDVEVEVEVEVQADQEMEMGEREMVQTTEEIEETVVVVDEDQTVGQIVVGDVVTTEVDIDIDDAGNFALDISGAEEIAEEPAFYLDVNPSMETDEPSQPILFDSVTTRAIGERSSGSSEEDEEEIVLVPRKHVQPEPIHLPEEPDYVLAKDGDLKPKESLLEKFGGKKAGKDGRPVATTSMPGKRTVIPDADEEITTASKGKKPNKKQAKREKRKNKKEERIKKTEGIPRHKVPRMDSDVEWGSDGPPRGASNELVTDEEDDAILRADGGATRGMLGGLSTKGLTGAKKREMELLMDYLENTVGTEEPESDEEDEDSEALPGIGGALTASSMAAFVKGMSGTNQVTIDEINDARMHEEEDEDEDGWESSSGSELTDEDEEAQPVASSSTKKSKSKLIEIAPGLLSQVDDGMDDISDEDDSEDDSEDEDDTAEMAGMGFGWAVPASSDSDSESDSDEDKGDDSIDQIFSGKKGKKTWADATDDFISAMDELVGDDDLVMGSGKKFEKNKLYNAIQNGDFGDGWATKPAPKGKKNKLKGVPKELQNQWEADRLKKAEKKRQRELERVEKQMSLYPAMRKQGKSKGKGKGIYAIDQNTTGMMSAKQMAAMFDIDTDSDDDDDFGGGGWGRGGGGKKRQGGRPPVTDLHSLNEEIRLFMRDLGKNAMTLPPMDKVSRKKVHEMAECYSLKSQSKGSGKARFPILIKTSRSSLEMVNARSERKLQGILGGSRSNGGDFFKSKYGKKDKTALPGSTARTGAGTQRHKDGDAVGGGASAIGQDNIGHRLLTMMGWTEGDRIGRSGGLDVPIVAIVKNTKLGLGA